MKYLAVRVLALFFLSISYSQYIHPSSIMLNLEESARVLRDVIREQRSKIFKTVKPAHPEKSQVNNSIKSSTQRFGKYLLVFLADRKVQAGITLTALIGLGIYSYKNNWLAKIKKAYANCMNVNVQTATQNK